MSRALSGCVVDPRYTRTAEQADIWCPIRSGTDIAFYGGMYNYIIEHLIEPNLAKYQETGDIERVQLRVPAQLHQRFLHP